jgi:hypothetical protein
MMGQSAMLWLVGALFLLLAPLVTHKDGPKATRFVSYVFILLGVLCVRFA